MILSHTDKKGIETRMTYENINNYNDDESFNSDFYNVRRYYHRIGVRQDFHSRDDSDVMSCKDALADIQDKVGNGGFIVHSF